MKQSPAPHPAGSTSPSAAQTTPPTPGVEDARRGFLAKLAAVVIGGFVGLVPLAAGLVTYVDPLFRRAKKPDSRHQADGQGKDGYVRVAALSALPVGGAPQRFPVVADKVDGWNFLPGQPIGSVYIERLGETEVRVFNTTCPHAGCSVSSNGQAYLCPCHNSSFNLDGSKRESDGGALNPSPRPLDKLSVDADKLAAGEVWVEFRNFYTGKHEAIPKL